MPRPIELLGAGPKAKGLAGYYERRLVDDTAAIAVQARLAVASVDTRLALGAIGKRWFADAEVLLLAEVDLQRQDFSDGPTRYQLAGYLGASKLVVPGVMAGAALQRWQPDLLLRSARDAFEVNLQYFPSAHFELHLLVRASGQGDHDRPGLLAFLQGHYYL